MKPYSTQSICIKCGTKHYSIHLCEKCEKMYSTEMISTEFHKKSDITRDRFPVNGKYYDPIKDVILRTCQNCGYQWLEKPLSDVKENADAT